MKAAPSLTVVPEGYTPPDPEALTLANLFGAMEGRTILSVRVTQVCAGEVSVILGSDGLGGHLLGVMALDDFDEKIYAGYEGFVGEVVDVIITGYDADRGVAMVNRREARRLKREQLFKHLRLDGVVTGVVRSIQPFGAFLDIGGVHALLPVNEISHSYVRHPADVVHKGDVLAVRVIAMNEETLRIRVSLKAMSDPWDKAAFYYARGAILLGTVSGVRGDQLWVRPEPYYGIEVLCPALTNPENATGRLVRVKLITVDPEARKLRGRIIGTVR